MGLFSSHRDARYLGVYEAIDYYKNIHVTNLSTVSRTYSSILKNAPAVKLSEKQRTEVRYALDDSRYVAGKPVVIGLIVLIAIISIAAGIWFTETCAIQVGIYAGGLIFIIGSAIVLNKTRLSRLHFKSVNVMESGNYTAYLNIVEDKKYGNYDEDFFYCVEIKGIPISVSEQVFDNIRNDEKILTVFMETDEGECLVLVPGPCYV